MSEEKPDRKSQYDRGFEHGIMLLSMMVDFYPKRPSAATAAKLGSNETMVDDIFSQLQRFRERIATEIRKGNEAAA
jgi:hypothetical protein